jgi:hypothetical protein
MFLKLITVSNSVKTGVLEFKDCMFSVIFKNKNKVLNYQAYDKVWGKEDGWENLSISQISPQQHCEHSV